MPHAAWTFLVLSLRSDSPELSCWIRSKGSRRRFVSVPGVVGLAGTGSKTLVLDNVTVPRHRVVLMPESLAGTTMAARTNPRSRQALPTRDRSPSGGFFKSGPKVAEVPTVQMKIATAAAALDAACALLLRDLQALGAEAQADQPRTENRGTAESLLCSPADAA